MSTFDSATWSSHPHSPPSFDALQSWLQAQGAYVDTRINGRHDGEFGWHIQACHDIEEGTLLCMIPKALVLSHQTCSLTRHIALPSDDTAAEVTLHLAACLLHELRLGVESTFWPALQMLPSETIPVPTFWARNGQDGQEALRWLQGTTAEKELKRKDLEGLNLSDIEAYFAAHSARFPLTSTARGAPTLSHYLYALSMIFTRGYVTDAYHTIALIPFCDLFNHSSASAHTSLLSDQCVCPKCGSLSTCEHDQLEASRVAHLTSEYIAQTEKEGRNVEMRAERAIRKGEQIFSCYEEGVDNGKLLVEWGYISPTTESVRWSAAQTLRREDGRAYLKLWQRGALAGWERGIQERRYGVDGASALFYSPENPGDFGLHPDGLLSANVILGCLLPVIEPSSFVDDGELEQTVTAVMAALEGDKGDDETVRLTGQIHGAVRRLLHQRLDELYPWTGSPDELTQAVQEPEPDRPLTKLAMALSLLQRRLLTDTARRWSKTVEETHSAQDADRADIGR